MSIRFRSQLQIDMMPDEQLDNRWEVVMPRLTIKSETLGGIGFPYTPIVESIHFAPLGFKNSTDIRAITNYYNVPLDKEDSKEANITFFCDTGMMVQYYISKWKSMMFNSEHEFYYLPWQYKRDIYVFFFGMGSAVPVAQFILKGCYPIMQSDYELQYSREPKRLRITQKFNVDRVVMSEKYKTAAISSALLAGNPLGAVADQLFASIGGYSGDNNATAEQIKTMDNTVDDSNYGSKIYGII